jgi:hypothetical protein
VQAFTRPSICSLPANHFVEGEKRSKHQSNNAKENDAKINALHAVDLVSLLITPASLDGSSRIVALGSFSATDIVR